MIRALWWVSFVFWGSFLIIDAATGQGVVALLLDVAFFVLSTYALDRKSREGTE